MAGRCRLLLRVSPKTPYPVRKRSDGAARGLACPTGRSLGGLPDRKQETKRARMQHGPRSLPVAANLRGRALGCTSSRERGKSSPTCTPANEVEAQTTPTHRRSTPGPQAAPRRGTGLPTPSMAADLGNRGPSCSGPVDAVGADRDGGGAERRAGLIRGRRTGGGDRQHPAVPSPSEAGASETQDD